MKILCSFAPEDASEGRTGEVLDLTDRGFFLASNTLYPPGTALALLVALPGRRLPVRLHGEVAWARASDRAGMFVRIQDGAAGGSPTGRAPAPATEASKKPRGPELSS